MSYPYQQQQPQWGQQPPRPGGPPATAPGGPPRPGMMGAPPGTYGQPRPGTMGAPPPRPGMMGAPPATAGPRPGMMGARPGMMAPPPATGGPPRPGMMAPPPATGGPPRPGTMGAPPRPGMAAPATAPGGPPRPGMMGAPPGTAGPPRPGMMGAPPGTAGPPRPGGMAPPPAATGPPRPGMMAPPPTSGPPRPGMMAPPPTSGPPRPGMMGPPPPTSGPPRPGATGPPPTGGPPIPGAGPPPPTAFGYGPPPPRGGPPTATGAAPMPAAPPMYNYSAGAGAAKQGGAPGDMGMPAAFAGGMYGPPGVAGAPSTYSTPTRSPPIDASMCCDPKYMSLTVGAIPASQTLATQSGMPFGLCVHPLAKHPSLPEIPVVDFGTTGVIRCKRCRTYVNPFATFLDAGRRWRCNMCAFVNDVPAGYTGPIDEHGRRTDAAERPELSQGSVEFVAPVEYMVRPPQSPVYVFVMDVSYNAVSSGVLAATCAAVKEALPRLPGGERTQVGFVTFDANVHFYSLRPSLSAPQMLVVPDVSDLFLPVPEDLLVNLSDSRGLVEQLLDALPKIHADTKQVETCLGAALDVAFSVMQHIGGKMLVFQSSLPSVAKGRLRNRDNPKLRGTDTEHTLFAPDASNDAQYYKHKAVEFSRQQISVDSFLTSPSYQDVATLGCLSRYTAGHVYHYPGFAAPRDAARLQADILRDLGRSTGFEAVMRIRCTRGLVVTNFYGNFFIRGTDLLALPNVSEDTAFSVEISHEDSITPGTVMGIQAALLYTTSTGERRICVHTMAAPVTTVLADMFKNVDVDAMCNLMSKLALDNMLRTSVAAARLYLHHAVVGIIRAYRTATTSAYSAGVPAPQSTGGGAGNPPLPEDLQLLPLYTMALQKSVLFRGGTDIGSDERSALVYRTLTMPVMFSKTFVYPRMFGLHNLRDGDGRPCDDSDESDNDDVAAGRETRVRLPQAVSLAADRLQSGGVFLLYDGVDTFLWVGRAAPPPLLEALFGVPALDGVDVANLALPPPSNDYAVRVGAVIDALHEGTPHAPRLRVVREGGGDAAEVRFHYRLVEDRANFHGGATSYAEYLAMCNRDSQMAAAPTMS